MINIWEALGIPAFLPATFGITDTRFALGNEQEWFDDKQHYIPTTLNLWRAGDPGAREVLVSCSVLEMLAYLSLHRLRYPFLDRVALVSCGNLPSYTQLQHIRSYFLRPKFTLLFGADPLASLIDIRVACGLTGKTVKFQWQEGKVLTCFGKKSTCCDLEQVSLFSFERFFGQRSHIRTRKPVGATSFISKLKHTVDG